jgi:hypothetical protein
MHRKIFILSFNKSNYNKLKNRNITSKEEEIAFHFLKIKKKQNKYYQLRV